MRNLRGLGARRRGGRRNRPDGGRGADLWRVADARVWASVGIARLDSGHEVRIQNRSVDKEAVVDRPEGVVGAEEDRVFAELGRDGADDLGGGVGLGAGGDDAGVVKDLGAGLARLSIILKLPNARGHGSFRVCVVQDSH